MNEALKPFVVVRIKQLLGQPDEYDGWRVNTRSPQIGDTGTLIDILSTLELPNKYVVERCAPDGTTIWLVDFFAEELEIV
jgi:hypothetical protein